MAPAGLPRVIAARKDAVIRDALRQPEVVAKFRELDMTTTPMKPAEFGGRFGDETARMMALVHAANITPQQRYRNTVSLSAPRCWRQI